MLDRALPVPVSILGNHRPPVSFPTMNTLTKTLIDEIQSAPEAIQREALVHYERVVYTAFRDVADALAAYEKTSEQRGEQQRLVQALRESSRLSDARYRGGLDSYLPVLDAQRSLFEGELELTRLHQRELSAIVRLYRALGGGWPES